jgi:hypothetical protein
MVDTGEVVRGATSDGIGGTPQGVVVTHVPREDALGGDEGGLRGGGSEGEDEGGGRENNGVVWAKIGRDLRGEDATLAKACERITAMFVTPEEGML